MKRTLALTLAIIFALLTLAACGQTAETQTTEAPSPATADTAESPAAEPEERITITVGSYGETYFPFMNEFNTSQDKYIVEVIDYSQGDELDYDQAVIRLNADLATGNAPDVIYFFRFRIDPALYGRKGYLEDLYPYLDADPELSREDFVQSLLKAYEEDGALYQTVPFFGVMTILAAKSVADSIPEWTFADLIDFVNENGSEAAFGDSVTKRGFLSSCMLVAVSEYVDYSSCTAHFDSDEFKRLLEFCNTLDGSGEYNKDETSLLRFGVLNSFIELQYYEYRFNDEVSFIGYPSNEGGVSFFTNVMDSFGINSASEHKDAAWQLIRALFTEEYQDRHTIYIPSNLKSMQKKIEWAATPYIDEKTQIEKPRQGDHEFDYYASTDAQIEQMMELINSATASSHSNSTITNIVMEEAQAYFSGAKTVDEAASLIQGRVSLYLGEQK